MKKIYNFTNLHILTIDVRKRLLILSKIGCGKKLILGEDDCSLKPVRRL
jgi:hypothetical protein